MSPKNRDPTDAEVYAILLTFLESPTAGSVLRTGPWLAELPVCRFWPPAVVFGLHCARALGRWKRLLRSALQLRPWHALRGLDV